MGFIFEDCPDCGMVEGHFGECPRPNSLGDGLFTLYKDFTVQEVTLVTNRSMGDVIGYVVPTDPGRFKAVDAVAGRTEYFESKDAALVWLVREVPLSGSRR